MGTLRQCDISVGLEAPGFELEGVVDFSFQRVASSDFKGKYLIIIFYPNDFTFVCPTELIAFSDRVEEFRKIDCEVLAVSCDSKFVHIQWVNTTRKAGGLGELKYPLLADCNGDVAKAYGVYNPPEGNAFRGLFIIDRKQMIRQVTINDMAVGRSVDETLRLVQAFQFVDEHGEVCPANWKPGKLSMKPDVKRAKEYFEKQN